MAIKFLSEAFALDLDRPVRLERKAHVLASTIAMRGTRVDVILGTAA